MSPAETPFKILWRVFVEQFAANESATSDIQMRRAIIGVITFLITPGLFLMMKTMSRYELMLMVARRRNMPQLIETYLAQMAVLFVSYSMITTGLLTVFIWDTLVFDKRDAMVLGPLPLRGRTIVGAKLAALATFLVGTALAVNVTSGLAVRLRHGWARRAHPSATLPATRGHDWRRGVHVLRACDRSRTARACSSARRSPQPRARSCSSCFSAQCSAS